ncbi:MAG: PIN domain-containing protein [Deltaproteobacteria bacterium]|nr:PIN domain-containing protein [Deltaproteobacteria bacterium]
MSLAIDTNLFLYAHIEDFFEHTKARSFLKKILQQKDFFYISWQVYYEYVRLTTHPRVLKKPLSVKQACADLSPYLKHPHCRLLLESPHHEEILNEVLQNLPGAKGNFIHDCHYAALLKENGITKIATADTDFKKFDFLEVLNPCL